MLKSNFLVAPSPVTIAARRISRSAKNIQKKIRFVKQLKIRSISPLNDKPDGHIRLPFEGKMEATDILEKKVSLVFC